MSTTKQDISTWIFTYNTVSSLLCVIACCTAIPFPEFTRLFVRATQIFSLCDVVHAAIGLVRSNILITGMQISSRVLISSMFGYSPFWTSSFLAMVWGTADLVRYLYYNIPHNRYLKYLRYNLFYVLYPLGVILELYITFNVHLYLGCIAFVVYCAGFPELYNHMIKANHKQMDKYQFNDKKGNESIIFDHNKKDLLFRYDGTVTLGEISNQLNEFLSVGRQAWIVKDRTHVEYGDSGYKGAVYYAWSDKSLVLDKKKHEVTLKDLGLQVPWKLVYVLEYAGPLVIFPVLSGLSVSYPVVLMWTIHYLKRIIETLTVHTFSRSTMPFKNLGKNCGYYYGFAMLIALTIRHEFYFSRSISYCLMACFALSEAANFYCHRYLAKLRESGDGSYVQPTGFLFRSAACPNYGFEILAWLSYSLCFGSFASLLFTIVGGYQMYVWAIQKRKRNRKLFGETYKVRKLLIPFVL